MTHFKLKHRHGLYFPFTHSLTHTCALVYRKWSSYWFTSVAVILLQDRGWKLSSVCDIWTSKLREVCLTHSECEYTHTVNKVACVHTSSFLVLYFTLSVYKTLHLQIEEAGLVHVWFYTLWDQVWGREVVIVKTGKGPKSWASAEDRLSPNGLSAHSLDAA